MTPFQKLAMGFVLVVVDAAPFAGYDAVPDVVGWLLVLLGLTQVRSRMRAFPALAALAGAAALVSVVLVWSPAGSLTESAQWVLSLPGIVLAMLLCGQVAELAAPTAARTAGRFRLLAWVFLAVAGLPVLVYGGGLDVLLVPTAVLAVAANVYLIYLLFTVAKQPFAGATRP